MNILKATGLVIILTLTLLTSVCFYRAIFLFSTPSNPIECKKDPSHVSISEKTRPGLIDRFRQALQIKTITYGTRKYDANELEQLISFLTTSKCFNL